MIRIAAMIPPQNVSIFVPLVTLKKIKFLETLYIDEIGSPDQVHYVSIKILEIPLLLLVFLGEVDTYRGSDSTAIRMKFYKGPPCNIEKIKFSRNTLY